MLRARWPAELFALSGYCLSLLAVEFRIFSQFALTFSRINAIAQDALPILDPAKGQAIGMNVISLARRAKAEQPRIEWLARCWQFVSFRHCLLG